MPETTAVPVTLLLADWRGGDHAAFDRLGPSVYATLRRMAAARLRAEQFPGTLQPTALVNEIYLRMAGSNQPEWESRGHFYGVAGRLMRQILIQRARARDAGKRGDGRIPASLEDVKEIPAEARAEAAEIAQALAGLAGEHPRKAVIVELAYFGGMTTEEIAGELQLSASTIEREKRFALAWLRRYLSAR